MPVVPEEAGAAAVGGGGVTLVAVTKGIEGTVVVSVVVIGVT